MFGLGKNREGSISYCTHYYTSTYKGITIEIIYMDNHTVSLEINGQQYGSTKDTFTGLSTEDIGAQVFIDGEERFEFVNEYEFSMFVYNKLKDGEYKDQIFKIKGEMVFRNYTNPQTNEENTYVNYEVNRIYVGANDDLEQVATANMNVMLGQDCIDDSRLDEDRLLVVNGYVTQYESKEQPNKGYYKD